MCEAQGFGWRLFAFLAVQRFSNSRGLVVVLDPGIDIVRHDAKVTRDSKCSRSDVTLPIEGHIHAQTMQPKRPISKKHPARVF